MDVCTAVRYLPAAAVPNVGVHMRRARVSAARRDCLGVYKTALQDVNGSITHCLPILPKGEIAFS